MKKILIALICLLPATIFAQEFKLSAEVRPRFESYRGTKTLRPVAEGTDVYDSWIAQRSRLIASYVDKDSKIKSKLVLQNVHSWGAAAQLTTSSPSVGVHEAWGEVLFTEAFSLKAGRQELVYDNSRILGNVGWAQQARSHDLALLKYEEGAVKAHLGFAYNKVDPSYKAMQLAWVNYKADAFSASFLFLNNGKEKEAEMPKDNEILYSQTVGAHIQFKKGKLGITAAGYYQGGKNGASYIDGSESKDISINAYNVLGEVSFAATDKLSVLLGGEMLSGTDQDAEAGTSKSFTPLYGTNHKFNGLIDFFYVGNHVGNVGLTDLYAKVGFKQGKFNVGGHFHFFNAAAKVLDNEGEEMSSGLGTELDLVAGYKLTKAISFAGGFSSVFGTETMAAIKGGDHEKASTWGWLMLTINPTLLVTGGK